MIRVFVFPSFFLSLSSSFSHLLWKWTWWRRHRPRNETVCKSCRHRNHQWAAAWRASRTSSSPFRRSYSALRRRMRRRQRDSKQREQEESGRAACRDGGLVAAISSDSPRADAPYIECYALPVIDSRSNEGASPDVATYVSCRILLYCTTLYASQPVADY